MRSELVMETNGCITVYTRDTFNFVIGTEHNFQCQFEVVCFRETAIIGQSNVLSWWNSFVERLFEFTVK